MTTGAGGASALQSIFEVTDPLLRRNMPTPRRPATPRGRHELDTDSFGRNGDFLWGFPPPGARQYIHGVRSASSGYAPLA